MRSDGKHASLVVAFGSWRLAVLLLRSGTLRGAGESGGGRDTGARVRYGRYEVWLYGASTEGMSRVGSRSFPMPLYGECKGARCRKLLFMIDSDGLRSVFALPGS